MEEINKAADDVLRIVEKAHSANEYDQLHILIAALVRWVARYKGSVELLTIAINALEAARVTAEQHFAAKKPS